MGAIGVTGIIGGVLAIIFGLVIIFNPKLIAWLVGIYFIIMGALAIIGAIF